MCGSLAVSRNKKIPRQIEAPSVSAASILPLTIAAETEWATSKSNVVVTSWLMRSLVIRFVLLQTEC
jgi:hypothetical protein